MLHMINVLSIKINFKMRKISGFKVFSSKETIGKIRKYMTKENDLLCLQTRTISGTRNYKVLRLQTWHRNEYGIASWKYRKLQSLQDSLAIRNANSTNMEVTLYTNC